MTILIYDTVGVNAFMTVYRDSNDPKLFYYAPQFATVSKRSNGRLNFGAAKFKGDPSNPNDGFAVFNFGVHGVVPQIEYDKMYADLQTQFGSGVRLAVISPDSIHPTLVPITDYGVYTNITCQNKGINLYTDLACSFTIPEFFADDMKDFFTSLNAAWAGAIEFAVRTKKTTFEWKITANWHRMLEHFKSQVSVKYWFVRANLSYETQKLIQNETLKIEISGGTPEQKELVYTMAEKIATRLFVPTLQPNPMPGHPSGGAVCFSVNYQKIEEDKTSIWQGKEEDFEVKPLGLASYVGQIPEEYFVNFGKSAGALYNPETAPGPFDIVKYVEDVTKKKKGAKA